MKRRKFLTQSACAAGGSWIAMSVPAVMAAALASNKARAEGASFQVLSAAEAAEFEAMAAQIIPSGDTPGATEAGAIYFMDTVLAKDQNGVLEMMRASLAGLQADISSTFDVASFAALDSGQQIQVLQGVEDTSFFNTIRLLTIGGMFSNPSYGGNRDQSGWKLIGFDGPRASQPPFGYYDAEYMEKGA